MKTETHAAWTPEKGWHETSEQMKLIMVGGKIKWVAA